MPVGSNTQAQNKLTETVKNAYENIVQTVSINEEKNEQDVSVYFKKTTVSQDINCNNEQGGKFLCTGVKKGMLLDIDANFTINKEFCTDLKNEDNLQFGLEGFEKDKLKVNIKCKTCNCVAPHNTIPNSPDCNSNGDKVCGGCDCQ